MDPKFTPDQINQIQSLGINITPPSPSTPHLLPLLSISGLTLISFGGLVFFKTKSTSVVQPNLPIPNSETVAKPTQVPKSIEHYLLASQQLFTQAIDAQTQQQSPSTVTSLLNQSLASANDSIKVFPNDFRAYLQRGQIYQSLIPSQPQLLDLAINDYLTAQKLNPNSAQITRTLATLFATKGDAQNTLAFLTKTVSLEPTKAQNFYDLARIQQQAGLISNAVTTYDQLLSILTDPVQKSQILSEKTTLEKLASQNTKPLIPQTVPTISSEPLIQASLPAPSLNQEGLIIAAPETATDIKVKDQTDSNSFSGNATLVSGQTSVTISSYILTPSSQVYVSTISGGKNQTLEVISKSKDSFTIGLLSPITEDINFKWWIVN